jgi:penicillin-binding protein 2
VVSASTGTGHSLASLPVTVAGKTGTAQASGGQPHAWFSGFFPYQNPRIAFCVFLEHGGPGTVACAVMKEILERMAAEGILEK